MLKNFSMRILAITFALSLVACVDQVTPVGIDDIDDNTDDGASSDAFKDHNEPTGRPSTDIDTIPQAQADFTVVLPQIKQAQQKLPPAVELNPVPRR